MNSTLKLIQNRRSIRIFSEKPVTAEEKGIILDAAMRSPTAGNMMLYTIIEIEDQELKDQLAITCDNQPFIAKAPFILLFLADYQRWFDYYTACGVKERCQELGKTFRTPQEGDLLLACCDALIAAQTAVIAAESLGLGSCYIGDILENCETHRRLFNLPKYAIPITLLCFGYPKPRDLLRSRVPRFSRDFITHKNTSRHFSSNELMEMFEDSERIAAGRYILGAQNFGQHNYFKKFVADFSIEMSRSSAEMIKHWCQ